jgi:hypothetical protein
MFRSVISSIALAIGLSCAVLACESSAPTCERDPAALDQLDRELTRCAADPDCPCGARCASIGVCTYDCRADEDCGIGGVCSEDGACAGAVP